MSAVRYGKVAVLMGGPSAEREVSLKSGTAVLAALQGAGVDAHTLDAGRDIIPVLERGGFDRAFIALHGRFGEDGVVQGALDTLGLPYTGSGVLGCALSMDKLRCKQLWLGCGIPSPEFVLYRAGDDALAAARHLGFPLFVKPSREGSSIGISKVRVAAELEPACRAAAGYDSDVLIERAVSGKELTVAVIGDQTLPTIRLETSRDFYDYEAKYLRDDTVYHCPSGLPADVDQVVHALARRTFDSLGCSGWGRVDVMLDPAGRPYVLEVNTVPGMTDHSLVPMAARAAGIDFGTLVLRILDTSFRPRGDRHGPG